MESVGFAKLLEVFSKKLEDAFQKNDAQIILQEFQSYADTEKKPPMDQAFRELLVHKLRTNVEDVGKLLRLSVDAVRLDVVSVTCPVVLLGDVFEVITLDECDRIFSFVEEMVEVWKEEIFFINCKNNILRMCNDLLRRMSRAQNTVFCGRILLFLSKFFPFSERSGLNIISEFNVDNVTEYGLDGKEIDDSFEETVEDISIKIDYNLYCKFWSLQDFFRSPTQCYNKAQWKMFQMHAETILEAFDSFKLEEQRINTEGKNDIPVSEADLQNIMQMEIDLPANSNESTNFTKKNSYFAKFLTNPKLLALQLSDSNFRRSVLVQFLILFQYLQSTVKFKIETYTLTAAQSDFIKETQAKVYRLLEETPPNGKRFANTVRHMLEREELWNNWKNDGCKEFKKPVDTTETQISNEGGQGEDTDEARPPPVKRVKRPLGDCLRDASRSGKFYLGHDMLTKLWNYAPDNLQACKSEERNFLPQLESYLENPREKSDPSYEWRALRLLARQSPHFFVFMSSNTTKIGEYLESVRRRILKEKLESAKMFSGNGTTTGVINGGGDTMQDKIKIEPQDQDQEDVALQDTEIDVGGDADDAPINAETASAQQPAITVSREHCEEIAPHIGSEWKKLGKKLGFEADVMEYFETENKETAHAPCVKMLLSWFSDDEDATLDNFAYILEGLELNAAAECTKALIEKLTPPAVQVD